MGLVLFLFTKPVLSDWVILLLVWGDDHLTEWRVMAIQQTSHMALTPKQNLFDLLDRLWPNSQVPREAAGIPAGAEMFIATSHLGASIFWLL